MATKFATPVEVIESPVRVDGPLPATRNRPPLEEGVADRFADSDSGTDLTRLPVIGRVLKLGLRKRAFQFSIILPSQILFWLVVFTGIFGVLEPTKNFATAITWYIWFALMFPLTLIIGRAWCVTCPFGGFGEWIQRKTLWARKQKSLGLGWKMPKPVAEYGLFLSAVLFATMTWLEEFFNIAGPGKPILTSFMIIGIISFSVLTFVLFERRTFCRYLCPLSSLIGTAGSTGVVAGFRPKEREKCLSCQTKDCIRGGEKGYGCPWYVYPASADTNSYCGLCSECYKACPYDNVGMYVQKPLTSVVAPKKRADLALAAAVLFGLVIFQQWNALGAYSTLDGWLNDFTHFPNYPNPIDFIVSIAAVVGILAGLAFLISRFSLKTKIAQSFRGWFAPMMYGFIPLMGADFLARVMPKFLNNAALAMASIASAFGKEVGWADFHILSPDWLLRLQYIIVGLGTAAAVYAISRIARKDFKQLTEHPTLVGLIPTVFAVLVGAGLITLFFFMNGAE
jgi:NosR/NirI family transcriptional regulator, nitrous oxide reductase regulator